MYLHQQAVLVNQDNGPLVASGASEAIASLEAAAQARHVEAMKSTKNKMHEMAQQRLRTAESSLAGQAQEAYNKRVADMNLANEAEAMQAPRPRSDLQAADPDGSKLSEFEAQMNDMGKSHHPA